MKKWVNAEGKTAIEVKPHLSYSQYTNFVGTLGKLGCEASAMAQILGHYEEEKTTALLVGGYVDAHFDGTLDVFVAQNPEIMTKAGSLRADFVRAIEIINRIESDKLFMQFMSGEKQVELTSEIFGVQWKSRIDSLHVDTAIVDLKVVRSLTETKWVKDHGKVNFIEYWGYEIQGAIYQKIVEQEKGKKLPFYIAGASKENVTNIEIIGFDQQKLDDTMKEIEMNVPRIMAVKKGEAEPDRCERCDYCRQTKVLKAPIHYSELLTDI